MRWLKPNRLQEIRISRIAKLKNVKRIFLTFTLLCVSLTSACSRGGTRPQKENSTAKLTNSQEAEVEDARTKKLRNEIEQITLAAKGRVGVAAVVLETGETVSLSPHDHFPMQSVYKLPISMAVLKQVDAGKIKLDQKVSVTKKDFVRAGQNSPIRNKYPNGTEITVNELLRYAISESDGTASDVLIKLAGGPGAIQTYLSELKITDLTVLNTEREIGQDWETQYRNWSSPEAAVALLRALHERRGLSESGQMLLVKFMIESTPGPKRLKGLLPTGTIVAHKTGTSGTQKGITAATNDIGIITLTNGKHLAIAVFVADSAADEASREGVIAKIARAVWDTWSR